MPLITIKECLTEGPCKGQSHEWEYDSPTLGECSEMASKGPLTLRQFEEGLNDIGSEHGIAALRALINFLHRRNGFDVRWDKVDFKLQDFDLGMTAAEQAEFDAAKAELGKAAADAAEEIRTSGVATEVELTPKSLSTLQDSGSTSD